jgi:tetratricopeptide (TPR) repeat protein
VLRDAPDWAVAHGVVPPGFAHFSRVSTTGAHRDVLVLERIAALYAVLGRYERAIAIDREILGDQPGAFRARRRLTWCLLRIGRYQEAVAAAGPLEARPERDLLSHRIARAARRSVSPEAAADPRAVTAIVPLFSSREASWLVEGIAAPVHRAPRD